MDLINGGLNNMRICIGVPVHNCLNYTKLTLFSFIKEHLKRNYPPQEMFIDFVIVDNASTDGTEEYIKEFVNNNPLDNVLFHYIKFDQNYGCSKSFNKIYECFDYVEADLCILINNDIVFSENWLDHLLEFYKDFPECGIISSHVIDNHESLETIKSWVGDPKDHSYTPTVNNSWYEYSNRVRDAEKSVYDEGSHGCLFVVTKECRQAVGDWDEGFKIGCWDDTDYIIRCEKAGYKVLTTHNCVIWHAGGTTQHRLTCEVGHNWWQEYNRQYFMQKYGLKSLDGVVTSRSMLWLQPAPCVNIRFHV